MEQSAVISYYCFNRYCIHSIFNKDGVPLLLPLTPRTLENEQSCPDCKQNLVCLPDLEIKIAMSASAIRILRNEKITRISF